jgi:hypothetical protein
MFLIRADHAHHTAASDDLALVANPFDRCSDLHNFLYDDLQLLDDPSASHISWTQFQPHAVPDQHADKILTRSARRVRRNLPRTVDFHAILRVRQRFPDDPLND